DSIDDVRRLIETYLAARTSPIAFLIDGFDAKLHGGSGKRADWRLVGELAQFYPVILAGGLTPENVGEAIAVCRPMAVDVSSGVETAGLRDEVKISTFVEEAKTAFSRLSQIQPV